MILLLLVSITDIKEFRIPNSILGAFILIRGGILIYEVSHKTVYIDNMIKTLILMIGIFVIGVLIKVISHGGIGFGDVKLLICVVAYVGYEVGVRIIYSSIFIVGVINSISLVLRVKTRKDIVPFAPAVLLGALFQIVIALP